MRKVPNEICWNVSHDSRMLYSKRLARFAWNTKRFTHFAWNTKRFKGNIKLFIGNDSRLTWTVNRLQETILALKSHPLLVYLYVSRSVSTRIIWFCLVPVRMSVVYFLFRLNPVPSLISRYKLVVATKPPHKTCWKWKKKKINKTECVSKDLI